MSRVVANAWSGGWRVPQKECLLEMVSQALRPRHDQSREKADEDSDDKHPEKAHHGSVLLFFRDCATPALIAASDRPNSRRTPPFGYPLTEWLSTERTAELYREHPEYFRTDPNAMYRSIVNLERNADEVIGFLARKFEQQPAEQ